MAQKFAASDPHLHRAELPQEEFLTSTELMKLLKIKHKQTIYKLIDEGLPVIRVGRHYRFIRSEVVHYLKEVSRLNNSATGPGGAL